MKKIRLSKLTKEELQEFKEVNADYQKAVFDLGILEIDIANAKQTLDNLNGSKIDLIDHLRQVTTKQQEMSVKLGEKYGDKQVDLETGELK
jgi:hypothetical protein